ncbi:uncharacterized protein BJX67DRAFT_357338 [Aspergillus lucknowensis]|uniref:Uncharacterized protein n=1 Tax=Aspergillus lucknowensis TaxID=176173 RepID=A0ABR4LQX1_9EURO
MFPRPFAFRVLEQSCPKCARLSGLYSPNPPWRYFSSSIARTKAATKVKNPQQRIQHPTPSSSQSKSSSQAEETLKFAGRRPMGFAKLERKVAKEGELVLFEAPSHRSYVLGAYGIAGFCFAYSIYHSNAVFRDPLVEMPMWQKGLTGGICVMMSAMGTVFLSKTARLIRTIRAVSFDGQTHIRFTVRRLIPLRKPYEIDVLPCQIAFSRRLVVSPEALRGERAPLSPLPTGLGVKTLLKAPFKMFSMLLWRVFRSVRQLFTSEDFILLELEGQKGGFRMDSGGYVSKDFLAVGNPLAVKR